MTRQEAIRWLEAILDDTLDPDDDRDARRIEAVELAIEALQHEPSSTGDLSIPRVSESRPPYRNLRIWVESFDLALDVFQLTRTLGAVRTSEVARRLIEASSAVPLAIARGQVSGSAAEFLDCVRQVLCHLTALEGHLMECRELRLITVEQLRLYQGRVTPIRKAANALLRRLARQVQPAEQGAAPTRT